MLATKDEMCSAANHFLHQLFGCMEYFKAAEKPNTINLTKIIREHGTRLRIL
jgi:hypothetical protein